jgi:hypothetical protein
MILKATETPDRRKSILMWGSVWWGKGSERRLLMGSRRLENSPDHPTSKIVNVGAQMTHLEIRRVEETEGCKLPIVDPHQKSIRILGWMQECSTS